MVKTVIATAMHLKMPFETNYIKNARALSITITSFENLVTILPIGLESKKRILARRTRHTTLLCKLVPDVIISMLIRHAVTTEATVLTTTATRKLSG